MQEIKVAVSGAFGNMGREVCRAVCEEKGSSWWELSM